MMKSEFKFNQEFNKFVLHHYKLVLRKAGQKAISYSSRRKLNPRGELGGDLAAAEFGETPKEADVEHF
jgi:hypothetical protein